MKSFKPDLISYKYSNKYSSNLMHEITGMIGFRVNDAEILIIKPIESSNILTYTKPDIERVYYENA